MEKQVFKNYIQLQQFCNKQIDQKKQTSKQNFQKNKEK